MTILFPVFVALAAALWAAILFMRAAGEGREAVRDIGAVLRRGRWSRRISRRLIENLSDPREAAAVLLYQIAAYDGAVTDRQHVGIAADMSEAFEVDAESAEGFFAFGRMAVGEINDAANSLRKILRPIASVCAPEEQRRLIEMMQRAAEIEGSPGEAQRRLIAETRRILLDGRERHVSGPPPYV